MAWKPVHEAHAIDRVRILMNFASPLPEKLLARSAETVISKFSELGFDQIARAESIIPNIVLHIQVPSVVPEVSNTGWVLKRTTPGVLVEEAGFRDGVFGYFSIEYGRWENLFKRLWDLFSAPLEIAFGGTDIATIRLEYWDRFAFEGEPQEADVGELLVALDPVVPPETIAGKTLMHSHSGWLEDSYLGAVLVNRNIDLLDENTEAGARRICNILTLVELRSSPPISTLESASAALELLHRRSLTLFGSSIAENHRQKIGLNLEDYRQ